MLSVYILFLCLCLCFCIVFYSFIYSSNHLTNQRCTIYSDAHGSSSSNCDTYDFISSLIFFDNTTATDAYGKHRYLLSFFYYTQIIIILKQYKGSIPSYDVIYEDIWRENAYSFCNGSCSLYAINSFGDSLNDHAISQFMNILDGGACEDVLSMPFDAFSSLVSVPPEDLTEKYYECNTAPADAFNDAIGIASGNTATIVPIVFMVLLPFIYLWITISGGIAKHEYQREEKDDMQDKLILYLLRARDGKVRSMKPNSPIVILSNEIEHLSSQMGGYPDSDDSQSSDEDSDELDQGSSSDGGGGLEMQRYPSSKVIETVSNSSKSRNNSNNNNGNRYAIAKNKDSESWV